MSFLFSTLIGTLINLGLTILLRLLTPGPDDQVVEGSRLDDLSVTSSAYGQPIFLAEGTIELGGQVIWAGDGIIEDVITTVEEISDGGLFGTGFLEITSKITTIEYRYFLTFAVLFAEGPAERILKIKFNDKIIYDITVAAQITSNKPAIYLGTETQVADPVIRDHVENEFGTGSSSAHLGVVYTRWTRYPLADHNNRVPRVKAEIAFNISNNYPRDDLSELSGLSDPGSWYWGYDPTNNLIYVGSNSAGGELLLIDYETMTHVFTIDSSVGFDANDAGCLMSDGRIITETTNEGGGNGSGIYRIDLSSGLQDGQVGVGTTSLTDEGGISFESLGSWADETIKLEFQDGTLVGEIACHFPGTGGIGLVEARSMTYQEINIGLSIIVNGGDPALSPYQVGVGLGVYDPDNNVVYFWQHWASGATDPGKMLLWKVAWNDVWDEEGREEDAFTIHYDGPQAGITITEVGRYDPTAELFVVDGVCLLISENSMIVSIGARGVGDVTAEMAKIDLSDGSIVVDAFTNNTYGSFNGVHKIRGNKFAYSNRHGVAEIDTSDLSLIKQNDGADDIGLTEAAGKNFDWEFFYDEARDSILLDRHFLGGPIDEPRRTRVYLGRGAGAGTPLDEVVSRYCLRAGMVTDDLSLSAIASDLVSGYALTRVGMSAKNGLQPLLAGFLFDLIMSDWKLKAVKRGGASILTLDENFLGEASDDPDNPPVQEPRTQEVDIPREVEVWFNDRTLDYERGVEPAMRMIAPLPSMSSVGREKLDLSTLVVTPDYAKQLAEKFLWTLWEERTRFKSRVPWKYLRMDPADTITIPYHGDNHVVRVNKMEVGANFVIEFEATRESAFTIVSSAVAEDEVSHLTHDPSLPVPSKLILLDGPILNADDESFGDFLRGYLGVSGFGSGVWKGATVTRGGTAIATTDTPIAWGFIKTAPTTFDALRNNIFQETAVGGTMVVVMRDGGASLSSESEIDVLNGANLAAIVTGGIVEVFKYQNVSDDGDQQYTFTRLLRGRKGTEEVGADVTHLQGSLFVVLDDNALRRFSSLLSNINIEKQYKAVTFGQDVADASVVLHTDTGRDRRPLGPVYIRAAEESGPTLVVDWIRRTRFNGDWLDGIAAGGVPLNEDLEEYVAILTGSGGSESKTVTDVTQAIFDNDEVENAAGSSWGGGDLPAGLSVEITQSSITPGVSGIPTTEGLS